MGELICELGPAREAPVVNAYKWMHEDWQKKKKGLGPAFATKLLYVLSEQNNRAPIIDAVVSKWLQRKEISVSSTTYDESQYELYINFVDECLDSIKELVRQKLISHRDEFCDRGFIEYLIFQDELYWRGKSKRVENWIVPKQVRLYC